MLRAVEGPNQRIQPTSRRFAPHRPRLILVVGRMNKLPSDLRVLECIYRVHASAFVKYSKDDPSRSSKIYVPMDLSLVAAELRTDPHILFGRLYYDLDNRYRYKNDDASIVHLFAFAVGEDRHCVNYPYLAGVLAGMRQESSIQRWTLVISAVSLVISFVALLLGG